nr:MAG TPA: hypothetical protein [Caudoviricetes sp.]
MKIHDMHYNLKLTPLTRRSKIVPLYYACKQEQSTQTVCSLLRAPWIGVSIYEYE